jgi:OOP family OmpA-OmpF porin
VSPSFLEANRTIPYVLIAGHTDSSGTEVFNQQLSQRRAEAVRQYLIDKHGIAAAKIQAKGYGSSQPVADNGTPEGRYQNRRVEVVCCTILPE